MSRVCFIPVPAVATKLLGDDFICCMYGFVVGAAANVGAAIVVKTSRTTKRQDDSKGRTMADDRAHALYHVDIIILF